MMTQTLRRCFFIAFILLVIFYVCTSEHDQEVIDVTESVDPLTVATARYLYEQHIGLTSRLKSATEDSGIDLLPDWGRGQLFSDSNWYVVESPLAFPNDRQLRLIAPGVAEYAQNHTNPSDIKQIQRLVVIRNKETGKTYAAVMLIAPSLNYMLEKGDRLDENSYLTRGSDLDGLVMFYTTDGLFVNGWIYEKGKVKALITLDDKTSFFQMLKSYYWECIDAYEYDVIGVLTRSKTCYKVHNLPSVDVYPNTQAPQPIDWGAGSGRLDTDVIIPLPDGGSGGRGNGDWALPPKDKTPEKRTDCSESATQNANNTQTVLGNTKIMVKVDQLRSYAKYSKSEYAMSISYDPGFGTYNMFGNDFDKGSEGDFMVNVSYNRYTVYTVHSHYEGLLASPSPGDLIAIVSTYKDIKSLGGAFRGGINVASDGSEYMIYVDNPIALEKFYNGLKDSDFFERNGSGFKKGSKWYNEYNDVYKKMRNDKYSESDAQSYALSYLADKYNMGLKISSRKSRNDTFKEQKTQVQETGTKIEYKPQICP